MSIINSIITLVSAFAIQKLLYGGLAIKNIKDEKKAIKRLTQKLEENDIYTNNESTTFIDETINAKINEKIYDICNCRLNVIKNNISSNSNNPNPEFENKKSELNKDPEWDIAEKNQK